MTHPLTGTAGALQAPERTRNENREAMERLAQPMTDHPLTDDIINENFIINFDNDDLRAAADWQLERDAEYFADYLVNIFGLHPEVAQVRATHFKQAMRTQQQEES